MMVTCSPAPQAKGPADECCRASSPASSVSSRVFSSLMSRCVTFRLCTQGGTRHEDQATSPTVRMGATDRVPRQGGAQRTCSASSPSSSWRRMSRMGPLPPRLACLRPHHHRLGPRTTADEEEAEAPPRLTGPAASPPGCCGSYMRSWSEVPAGLNTSHRSTGCGGQCRGWLRHARGGAAAAAGAALPRVVLNASTKRTCERAHAAHARSGAERTAWPAPHARTPQQGASPHWLLRTQALLLSLTKCLKPGCCGPAAPGAAAAWCCWIMCP